MASNRNIIALVILLIAIVAIVFYFNNRKIEEELVFVGYYGSQPQLKITTLSGKIDMNEIEPVIQAAQDFFNSQVYDSNGYWPEPESVSERENSYWVKFSLKEKIFLVNGKEEIQSVKPDGLCINVEKESLNCTLVPSQ